MFPRQIFFSQLGYDYPKLMVEEPNNEFVAGLDEEYLLLYLIDY